MTERLRVMLLVSHLEVGGAERQLVELAGALDVSRFEAVVATLYRGPLDDELSEREGARLISLERRGRFDFTTPFKLARFLQQEDIHIIQPFLPVASTFGLLAAMIARTPIRIATERGGVGRSAGARELHPYAILERRLARQADIVVANSGSGRDDLIARGFPSPRVRVIHNGVNPERIRVAPGEGNQIRSRLGIPASAPVAGMIARLAPMKDHVTLLQAVKIVLEKLPAAYLVLVGEGELRTQLEQMTAQLGLGERVLFAGRETRVAPYIAAFDLAVLSSKEKEGCSNFILEAMGMGKPVVCTDAGGNGELIQHGRSGLVVPAQDAERLAQAMTSVLANPDLGRAMGRRGREVFQARFTLKAMVESYERLYDELWAAYGRRLRGLEQSPA